LAALLAAIDDLMNVAVEPARGGGGGFLCLIHYRKSSPIPAKQFAEELRGISFTIGLIRLVGRSIGSK
jgi:hypothetical protein